MRQGECAASWAPARGVRRRGEVGKVRLREANVLETSMLCLFYYLRGPVVPVFRIYKDRISIIKWKRWSRFAHPETTARSRARDDRSFSRARRYIRRNGARGLILISHQPAEQ